MISREIQNIQKFSSMEYNSRTMFNLAGDTGSAARLRRKVCQGIFRHCIFLSDCLYHLTRIAPTFWVPGRRYRFSSMSMTIFLNLIIVISVLRRYYIYRSRPVNLTLVRARSIVPSLYLNANGQAQYLCKDLKQTTAIFSYG